eukprot:c24248_g11_i1 orf=92-529(+)
MARKSPQTSLHALWEGNSRNPSQWWKAGPAYPHFQHRATKEDLWIDGSCNPSWVGEELRRRGLGPCYGELWKDDEKVIHHKALVFHDQGTAFVALLRACAKKKDLQTGTRIHTDVLKRGLLEKCSDALVTMYAKCNALAKAKELF